MALFKTAEEKAEKAKRKTDEMLAKYGLENLRDPQSEQSVRKIVEELAGTGIGELGVLLGGSERECLRIQMQYQRAIVEQNFMIIRLLDKIASQAKE